LNLINNKKEKKEFLKDDNYSFIKNIEFKCYILSYKKDLFGSSEFGMKKASEIGRERGGIKVYSDNFRVFGYGRSGDDWLKVDYDRARSIESLEPEAMELKESEVDRPGLRIFQTRNLFGHVKFEKAENPLLEITVNRESLIENEAFEEVRHFTRLGIDYATVLYSNIVFKETEIKKEQRRKEEEREKKEALEEKNLLEEAKRKAEKEAKDAQEQRKLAEERAKNAEEEKRKAEIAARNAEKERRKAESERRKAEEERRKAELERNKQKIDEKKKQEEELVRKEEESRKAEEEARKKESEARKKAEEQEQKTQEEEKKQRKLEEEAERKGKEIEENERKKKEQELKEKEIRLEEERVLLRLLASTGTMMLMFQHELEGLIDDMKSIIINFRRLIAGKGDKTLESLIDNYDEQIEMIRELGTLMGSIIDRESRLAQKDWVILPLVENIIKPFKNYIKHVGASIKPEIPDFLRTPIMYKSEFISIIHNLITNSIKAIRTTQEKKIKIIALQKNNDLIIRVLDTGKGLEKEKWTEVFLPFTGYSEPDIRFGTGTGLGLKIVQDMVRSYNGDIRFTDAPDGWSTCIEVKFPKNNLK
jgi:signal transduction histidine kinase